MTRLALVVGAALVVAALGFGLGRATASPSSAAPSDPPTTPSRTPTTLVDPRVAALRIVDEARHKDFSFWRYTGVAYGDGFSDACAGLGAGDEECDDAYRLVHHLCSARTGSCFRPTPGYATYPGYIRGGLKRQLEKRIYERIEEQLCLQVETEERYAKWCE
jgi:hypothetical protein